MNKSYRLIYNEITQTWVAVAEIAKARGKRASGTVLSVQAAPRILRSVRFQANSTSLPGAMPYIVADTGQQDTLRLSVDRFAAGHLVESLGGAASWVKWLVFFALAAEFLVGWFRR